MTRIIAALALLSLTAACATTEPATVPTDRPGCPAALLADIEAQPILPEGATIPRPVDEADAAGLDLTLDHVASVAAWGRRGWARAEEARRWCEGLTGRK